MFFLYKVYLKVTFCIKTIYLFDFSVYNSNCRNQIIFNLESVVLTKRKVCGSISGIRKRGNNMNSKEIMKNVKIQLSKNGVLISNLVTYALLFKNLKSHYKVVKSDELSKKKEINTPYLCLEKLLLEHPELKNTVAINQDKEMTFLEMQEEINNLKNYLHYVIGSEKGERISVCAASSIEGIVSFFAMNSLGLVNARIFNGSKDEKIKNNILNFNSKTILIDENNIDVLSNIIASTEVKNVIVMSKCDISKINNFKKMNPSIVIETWEEVQRKGSEIKENYEEEVYSNDIASILYTSGSSGEPKPISIPNRVYTNMVKTVSNTTNEKVANGESVLGVVSHEYPYAAINSTIMILLLGKTLIMPAHSEGAALDFNSLFEKEPNKIQAIPSFYKLLDKELAENTSMNNSDRENMIQKLSELKYIVSGGEPYQLAEKKELLKMFMGLGYSPLLIDGFGFGEMGSATALKFGLSKYFLLMNGIEAKAIDPKTKKDLPKDQEGILCLSGPTIAEDYYNNEKATKESFVTDENGKKWFVSDTFGSVHGIAGRLIKLGGRIRECFITSDGKGNFVKVYSGNVENVILSTGLVEDCIVVQSDSGAVPSPVAYISLKSDCNLTKDEIINILINKCSSLEDFSQPTQINIEDTIKRTDANKKNYTYYKEKQLIK